MKVPIDRTIIDRVVAGVKYVVTGNKDAWHGPSEPVAPQAQEQANGRQYDYPVGVNIRYTTKDDGSVGYRELRALADGYDLLRLVIETRKDQISKLSWEITNAEEDDESDNKTACNEIKKALKYPDGQHDFDTWIRAIVEDLLVIDAPCILPRFTNGGEPYALELMDGSTIKRVIDATGRTPLPPEPAYQQILKGVPAVDYTVEELIYRPRNVRTNKLYGYSPVEQVLMTVNIAMRRQMTQLEYYTEGNVPEALIGVPENWTPKQIKEFQTYWDEVCSGVTAMKRKAKFVPGGITPTFTKDAVLKDGYDEWLARIICFAFSISPQALVAIMNRATAETAQQQAAQEGLAPLQKWIKSLMDYIIAYYFKRPDLAFIWDSEEAKDPKVQMETLTGYKKEGIIDEDEVRDKIGYRPFTPEQIAKKKEKMQQMTMAAGTDKPGEKPGEDEQATSPDNGKKPEKNEEVAEKRLGKSKKFSAINRERTTVKNASDKLEKIVFDALQKDAVTLAKKFSSGFPSENEAVEKAKKDMPALEKAKPQIKKQLQIIFDDGVGEGAAQIDHSFDPSQLRQMNKQAVDYSLDRSGELIKEISATTMDNIKLLVAEAKTEGYSAKQLADMIQESASFSEARSMMIARTETAFADIEGNLATYRAAGVSSKEWVANEGDSCDDCQQLDGVIVSLDEEFPNDGGDGPPYHPNCTCDILPIFED